MWNIGSHLYDPLAGAYSSIYISSIIPTSANTKVPDDEEANAFVEWMGFLKVLAFSHLEGRRTVRFLHSCKNAVTCHKWHEVMI